MTPQEQQMLDGLIERVRNTELPQKDNEADRRIQDTLGRDPNALYILCQTVLVQGYALEQAQKQLADLKQQGTQQQGKQPSFLEKIFGSRDPEPSPQQTGNGYGTTGDHEPQYGQPGYNRPGYNQPQYGQPQYRQPQYGQPQYGQPVYPPQGYPAQGYPAPGGFGGGGFGGGGFLQGALQTAAGVAMGELAFQSIEGLFRGFGHAAGYGSDRAVGFSDDSGRGLSDSGSNDDANGSFADRLQAANGSGDGLSSDIEDRRGESRGFFGGSDGDPSSSGLVGGDDSATDNGYDVDNSATEDGGSDFTDSGSYDDGGSFDDGGSYSDDN